MKTTEYHKGFRLQGTGFSEPDALLSFTRNELPELSSFLSDWFDTRPFIEVQTSGSTGEPKLIQLDKNAMRQSARATGEFFDLVEGNTCLLCLSPDYIAGKMMVVRALELGMALEVVKPSTSPMMACSGNFDFVSMVPLQMYNSLDQLYRIKKLIVGGGPVKREVLEHLGSVPTEVFASYGMTETSTHIALKHINTKATGKTSKGEPYRLLTGVAIDTDSRGCLVIQAPHLFEGELVTNDLVELVDSNSFHWLGRSDSVINSGGVKLIPEHIEEKMDHLIDANYFLCGLPDTMLGEKLVLCIEGEEWDEIRRMDLLNTIKGQKDIEAFEVPRDIIFISKFSLTPTGKINRIDSLKMLN